MGEMIENVFRVFCMTREGEILNPHGRRFRSTIGTTSDSLEIAMAEKGAVRLEFRAGKVMVDARPGMATSTLTALIDYIRSLPVEHVDAYRDGGDCVRLANDDRLLFRLSSVYRT